MDGVDLANSSTQAQTAASEAMDRAVNSASNTEQKASIVAESQGRSLRDIAQAILDGNATKSDAETLNEFADTLERFANTMARTRKHVETAQALQDDHHAQLEASRQQVKSYSLGSTSGGGGGGRHTGRYRSDYADGYSTGGEGGGGGSGRGAGGGISQSASRAMSSMGF